jgi:hypothetical protein
MAQYDAKVVGWADSGAAELFLDEYGDYWRYAVDAMDGTVAVERVDYASCEPNGRAGEFVWGHEEDRGVIYPKEDGDTYGVNCTEDHIAEGGRWVENEAVEAE